ncbi:MAG: 50S ribosomal protein L18 [Bacteroidetes bacterium]|nr:50S ribosomal protein L18 [Bacteroidota bacterium]
MGFSKEKRRKRIHFRIRKKIGGTPERPRLSIFRSNRSIYCQVIDDVSGHTLLSTSSGEAKVSKDVSRSEQAKQVGKRLAEKALAKNIDTLVFDRSGYLYHGRVKALAEGVREGGVKL